MLLNFSLNKEQEIFTVSSNLPVQTAAMSTDFRERISCVDESLKTFQEGK